MGGQVSSIKGKLGGSESRKRGGRGEKQKISILAFEVANVMSKSIVLWQSLSDQEILRLRTDVIKAEGVLRLVSDSEAVLLGLACREKLQDLMALAGSVARLGGRCQEAALQGFEHVFSDILAQSIDAGALEFPVKEMEAKVKKMERYIASTSNLYQELEILADLEQAVRRIHEEISSAAAGEDSSGTRQDNLSALEQKISWQRQEIRYLRELSLWNRTYDKIVMLLARTICTIHARIVSVFGPPAAFEAVAVVSSNGAPASVVSGSTTNGFSSSSMMMSRELRSGFLGFSQEMGVAPSSASATFVEACSNMHSTSPSPSSGTETEATSQTSPMRFSTEQEKVGAPGPNTKPGEAGAPQVGNPNGYGYRNGSVKVGSRMNGRLMNRLFFDPKFIQQSAPSSTLGGCALALHYANVIIIVEKMVKFPQLVGNDARDDLYRMLPKSLRLGLRSRLRTCFRSNNNNRSNSIHSNSNGEECVMRLESEAAAAWRQNLDQILGWLAPLAHNMIRWQSEHNFEQQVVSRTNVLLLQTLFFADQAKAEVAIVELLVGLNYLCWYEKEIKASIPALDYAAAAAASKDLDEYLDWQF